MSNIHFTHSSNPTNLTKCLISRACLPLSDLGAWHITIILCSYVCYTSVFFWRVTLKGGHQFYVVRSKWTPESAQT